MSPAQCALRYHMTLLAVVEGLLGIDMKSKKEKAKVYEKDGFWTYDGAIAGYNTKENAEAALEAGKKNSS